MLPKRPSKLGTMPNEKKESLRRQYHPLEGVTGLTALCIIVDKQGIILIWYLPGILSNSGQVGIPFPLSNRSGISNASQNTIGVFKVATYFLLIFYLIGFYCQ